MNTIKNLSKYLVFIGVVSCCFACNEETELKSSTHELNCLLASIEKNTVASTRGSLDPQDGWSTISFGNDDMVGLFAKTGNMDGDGSFINVPMMFSRAVNGSFQFDNQNLNMDRSLFQFNTTMFYYPYTMDIETNGMKLRTKKDDKGVERCRDVLMMGFLDSRNLSDKQQLSGNFNHLFSELIIVRGEGFEEASNREITVVMTDGYTRLRFIDNPSSSQDVRQMWKVPELYFDDSDMLSYDESRKWKAWPGQPIKIYEDQGMKEAHYVILPNLYAYMVTGEGRYTVNHTKIDYIEIYDNNNQLQKVSSFSLNEEGTKELKNSTRYPLEIKMEGLVPTVNPCRILEWGETLDITDERKTGIRSAAEFSDWQNVYNEYLSNPSGNYDSQLLDYGDKHINEDTQETVWHFYILNDIDFNENNFRILKLLDVLDGMGNQLSNLTIDDSFIGEIGGKGCLTNTSLIGLTVNNTSKTNSSDCIGALTNLLSGEGSIVNCEIDATLMANCNVGLMAGKVTGGTVDNCIFSGLIIGKGSSENPYRYLVGITLQPNVFSITGSDFSGIIFSNIN